MICLNRGLNSSCIEFYSPLFQWTGQKAPEIFVELAEPMYMTNASMEEDDSIPKADEDSQNPIPNEIGIPIIPLDEIRHLSLLWKAVDHLTRLYPLQSDKILKICIDKYSDKSTKINLEDQSQYESFISSCSNELFPNKSETKSITPTEL